MKKATLKTYLITLFALMLVFAMTLTAFACSSAPNKKTGSSTADDEAEDFKSLVANGDFSLFSGDDQPYAVSNWEEYTPTSEDKTKVVRGIVDTGANYAKNSSAWGDAANPFGTATKQKVLMIYNKEATVAGYTSTFKTAAYGYYKISVDVNVLNATAVGAYFRIYSGNGYAEFANINNTDAFTTYTFYLEASGTKDTEVTVRLSLGVEDKVATGYAFFDNVIAEELTVEKYNEALTAAETDPSDLVKFASMLYPDGEFDYYTYSTSDTNGVHTPASWSWTKVSNSSSSSTVKTGIVSTNSETWNAETYGENPGLPLQGGTDDHVLMIESNGSESAFAPAAGYFASKNTIHFDICTLYEITLWAKVTVDTTAHTGATDQLGARIVLDAGSKNYPTKEYSTQVINTTGKQNNGWAKITIYVLGNQFADRDFTLRIWLGDDEDSSTYVIAKAFFDKLSIKRVRTYGTQAELNAAATTYANYHDDSALDYYPYFDFFNLLSSEGNLMENGDFSSVTDGKPDGFEFNPVDDSKATLGKDVIVAVLDKETLTDEWTEEKKEAYKLDENPSYPYEFSNVLLVNNVIPAAFYTQTIGTYEINQSLCYRLTVWMKTVGLETGKSVALAIVDKDGTSKTNFSVSTSSDTDNRFTKNYEQYVFYIMGALPNAMTPNTNEIRLKISNGSGTAYDPSSYQKGAYLIANISLEQISYQEYTDKAGEHTTTYDSFNSNDSTVTNGNFNSYKQTDTVYDQTTGLVALEDDEHNDHLTAAISSWENNVSDKYGLVTSGGEKSLGNVLTKTATNNSSNSFTVSNILGKKVTGVAITGPNGYDKTFTNKTDWEKVIKIDSFTGKGTWASTSSSKSYKLLKTASDNDANKVTLSDLTDLVVSKIVLSGPNDFNKTLEGDIATYFVIDSENRKLTWADNETVTALEAGEYSLTVTTDLALGDYNVDISLDEKTSNTLIAGIINITNTGDYFNQFRFNDDPLDKDTIYDGWNATRVSAETQEKLVTFGQPNLLMITTRDGNTVKLDSTTSTKYLLRSPSVSLSANSYYVLKFYAKSDDYAIGEVYLTTTSTDSESAVQVVKNTNGWMEYNFIVETGLSSVSAYFEIYYGEKGNTTSSYHGTLLLDSFTYASIEEEEYNALLEKIEKEEIETKNAKFTTITFNNASATTSTTTPSGFSKTNPGTDTKTLVSGIISSEFEFVTDEKNNIGLYETVNKKDDQGNETTETEDVIIEGSALSYSDIFNNIGMNGEIDDHLLMINNRKATYQSYYFSNSITLTANSYFKFSAYVRTSHIEKDKYAKVYVKINDEPTSIKVNTEYTEAGTQLTIDQNEWQLITFYLKNDKDSDVSCNLYFELGENTDDGKLQGYLFVDNISLSKISADEFKDDGYDKFYEAKKDENDKEIINDKGEVELTDAAKAFARYNSVIVLEKDETPEENTAEETTAKKKQTTDASLIWAYITSIVIAAVLIAVIILWLFKKYYRPAKHKKAKKADYDRNNVKTPEEKEETKSSGSARDEYKD